MVEERNNRILEVNEPMLRCYPHHANLISGITTNDFDFVEIAPHYIQVIYNMLNTRMDFNFGLDILSFVKNYPYVDSYCYERNSILEKWGNYSDFACDMIDRGCYIYLLVDTYFIPPYAKRFEKKHMLHDMLIYGYDEENLYVADCFIDGKYSYAKINKKALDNATINPEEYDWLDGVHCWRFKENMYLGINMNLKLVKKMLNEYIHSSQSQALSVIEHNRRGRFGCDYVCGIAVYDKIINYVKSVKGERKLDIKIPYILLEQKNALIYICSKLEKQYCLMNSKDNIENLVCLKEQNGIILNLFIKYNMLYKESVKDNIITILENAKKMEETALKKLYGDISTSSLFRRPKYSYNSKKIQYRIDDLNKGNWKNRYGSKGFYIIGDRIKLPQDIDVYTNNCIYVSVFRDKADERALERSENSCRPVAYYLNSKEFNVEVRTKNNIKLSLYMVDYDKLGRTEMVYVQKKKSGEVIIKYLLEKFEEGRYLTFDTDEDVIISFRCISGPDAVLSGIFFD